MTIRLIPFLYYFLILFDVFNNIKQSFGELLKILFVQENLVLNELSILKLNLTLCDGYIVIIRSGGFYVKEISTFSRSYSLRVHLFSPFFIKISHYQLSICFTYNL